MNEVQRVASALNAMSEALSRRGDELEEARAAAEQAMRTAVLSSAEVEAVFAKYRRT